MHDPDEHQNLRVPEGVSEPPRSVGLGAAERKNIVMIHDVLPHFDASGSDLRLMDVVREIRRQGHALTFVARHSRNADKYTPVLEELGVTVVAGDPDRLKHIGENRNTPWDFSDLLRHGQFHLAILCHWFWAGISVCEAYMDDIRTVSPTTRILVLTDDRHGERERRMAAITGSFADWERGNDFETREVEIYQHADLVLYITVADKSRFLELAPGLPLEHLPMQAALRPQAPGYENRNGILFLGNFENRANFEALKWMLEEIWPRVLEKDPSVTLIVAGNGTPEEIANQHRNLKCLGRVNDLRPLISACRVFAAPIRYGTGINTKNLQAMAQGLPIVTTSIGAEGIQLENGKHALVADTAEEFAASLLKLNRDAALWEQIAAYGREFVGSNFSREHLGSQIRNIVERAASLPHKPATPGHTWSFRTVEQTNPEALTDSPRYRTPLRMLAYWQAGHRLLEDGHAASSLEQFRRVFCMQRGINPHTALHVRVVSDMASAYRDLGDQVAEKRCEQELTRLRRTAASDGRPVTQKCVAGRGGARPLDISIVIPTYNRKKVLQECLCALAFQTLDANRWEIIVVDDGSTDVTADWLRNYAHPNAHFRFLRQTNSGVGAARRNGVEAARGEFVLFINDDTIADSQLLSQHLAVHREHSTEKWAVLGSFDPSEDCIHRALSTWINHSSFLFPQDSLKAGALLGSAYFVTCNLSVPRNALLEAGNFDPRFRVAEDTELGARLVRFGYRVHFHPDAKAVHEHAEFTTADLLGRARAYGRADWLLFQKHPQLLGDGAGPFGLLQERDFARIRNSIEQNREAVRVAVEALQAMDKLEMAPLLEKRADGSTAADGLWRQLNTVVPLVYWQHLYESFLDAEKASRQSAGTLYTPGAVETVSAR